ncbi:ATP-binding protein [Patescibacteria group bacterium]|nr:ATP-binding protein [Patescibacteria group bacterium]MBU4141540.1 ATP-binding protein [Patescibacteria group bacterium]MBU4338032.1 ATP-binding protein [Patescibacteria group bacterium]
MQKIARKLFNELKIHLDSKEISLIVGPRQSGKTTLMLELKKYLEQKGDKTVFFNLDFESDKIFFESQSNMVKRLELELGKNKGYVFIDEIQRKDNAGLFLKGLYDMNFPYKFIISGSGSLELKEKIHESLAGRKRLFELGTVSFEEFVDFKTSYKYSGRLNEFFKLEQDQAAAFLSEYLNFGGYPRVILEQEISEKIKIINEIFRSYIEKDIAYLLNVDRVDAFSVLIKILASQLGQIIKYSKLAGDTGVSIPTVKNYIWYAEKTFSVKLLRPFFKNHRKEITKSPIAYFYDLGLRNFALGLFGNLNQPSQFGFVFQNFIANGLWEKIQHSSKNLGFWRTLDKTEVDFVISSGEDTLPIEVKYAKLNKPEIARSLRSFIKEYNPREAWVVNLTLEAEIKIGKTVVKFIPFYEI